MDNLSKTEKLERRVWELKMNLSDLFNDIYTDNNKLYYAIQNAANNICFSMQNLWERVNQAVSEEREEV